MRFYRFRAPDQRVIRIVADTPFEARQAGAAFGWRTLILASCHPVSYLRYTEAKCRFCGGPLSDEQVKRGCKFCSRKCAGDIHYRKAARPPEGTRPATAALIEVSQRDASRRRSLAEYIGRAREDE